MKRAFGTISGTISGTHSFTLSHGILTFPLPYAKIISPQINMEENNMKKVIAFTLVAVMALAMLVSC
ncbi:MAG: hypothetical protein J6X52_05155, partial [Clostridia bacterium]|nr:hypothetical protein [Clostridia bacterium]